MFWEGGGRARSEVVCARFRDEGEAVVGEGGEGCPPQLVHLNAALLACTLIPPDPQGQEGHNFGLTSVVVTLLMCHT